MADTSVRTSKRVFGGSFGLSTLILLVSLIALVAWSHAGLEASGRMDRVTLPPGEGLADPIAFAVARWCPGGDRIVVSASFGSYEVRWSSSNDNGPAEAVAVPTDDLGDPEVSCRAVILPRRDSCDVLLVNSMSVTEYNKAVIGEARSGASSQGSGGHSPQIGLPILDGVHSSVGDRSLIGAAGILFEPGSRNVHVLYPSMAAGTCTETVLETASGVILASLDDWDGNGVMDLLTIEVGTRGLVLRAGAPSGALGAPVTTPVNVPASVVVNAPQPAMPEFGYVLPSRSIFCVPRGDPSAVLIMIGGQFLFCPVEPGRACIGLPAPGNVGSWPTTAVAINGGRQVILSNGGGIWLVDQRGLREIQTKQHLRIHSVAELDGDGREDALASYGTSTWFVIRDLATWIGIRDPLSFGRQARLWTRGSALVAIGLVCMTRVLLAVVARMRQ